MSGEFDLIDWIQQRSASTGGRLLTGIGDDAAVIDASGSGKLLVTTDLLIEGVHFTFPPATPELAGRKSLAVSLSDIAAMAGTPTEAFVSVSLPRDRGPQFAEQVMSGLLQLADEFSVSIAGGDTNIHDGPLIVNVAVLGTSGDTGPIGRAGAQVGDWLFVTGSLGGSLAGRHLSFEPRVNEAIQLARTVNLHALIDVSDGLASDLFHVLTASHVGASLRADSIPIAAAVPRQSFNDRLNHALHDGEDFELLFAVSEHDGQRLLRDSPVAIPLTHIGSIEPHGTVEIVHSDGSRQALEPGGWEHSFLPGEQDS